MMCAGALLAVLLAAAWPSTAQAWEDPCAAEGITPVAAANIDNSLWATILSTHVKENRTLNGITANLVTYNVLREDPEPLRRYLQQFCNTDVESLPVHDAVALLINLYNALMMLMVVYFDPASSVLQINNVWKVKLGTLNGKKVSLDNIEHDIVRKGLSKEAGVEGRAHAGFVCASLACPDLRPEPYEGTRLVEQLTEQTQLWLENPTKNPGLVNGKLRLSMIFKWYRGDFVGESGSVPAFVESFSSLTGLNGVSVEHVNYDWNLNAVNGTADWSHAGLGALPARCGLLAIVAAAIALATAPH
mmetsp:Transcript_2805/g.6558  ORF Transcript_2805/g.6558 Transcript_2805/m.6558 type:complete len:303 (+) Transcript_2805:48-956(+)